MFLGSWYGLFTFPSFLVEPNWKIDPRNETRQVTVSILLLESWIVKSSDNPTSRVTWGQNRAPSSFETSSSPSGLPLLFMEVQTEKVRGSWLLGGVACCLPHVWGLWEQGSLYLEPVGHEQEKGWAQSAVLLQNSLLRAPNRYSLPLGRSEK